MIKLIGMVFALALLSACGGGGGGSDSNPGSQTGSTINTIYSKGLVDGATANLHDAGGNTIAGPVITINGHASFENITSIGLLYVSFAGGSYTDEATSTTITLAANFVIRSGIINNSGSGSLDIVATPLTEIAYQRAESAVAGIPGMSVFESFMAKYNNIN